LLSRLPRRIWREIFTRWYFWAGVITGSIFAYGITAWIVPLGNNPAARTLITVSSIILAFSVFFSTMSQAPKSKTDELWNEEKAASAHHYSFLVKHSGTIFGNIEPITFRHKQQSDGRFSIRHFRNLSDHEESKILYEGAFTREGVYIIPECPIEVGEYHFRFFSQGLINFTLSHNYTEKPYLKLMDVGLVLLEVGIPLFITGIILEFFNVVSM